MESYDIAVIPGDGVGKEVAREALKILNASAKKYGFGIKMEKFQWGCDYYLENGTMNPENMLDILSTFDAIFLGCVGDENKVPDHVSLNLLLNIRYGFDQYVNLRPIKLCPGVESPITTATPETVDMVVIRENSEGEYSRAGGIFKPGTPDAFALQTGVFTKKGCERIVRYAFDFASKRSKRECSVLRQSSSKPTLAKRPANWVRLGLVGFILLINGCSGYFFFDSSRSLLKALAAS